MSREFTPSTTEPAIALTRSSSVQRLWRSLARLGRRRAELLIRGFSLSLAVIAIAVLAAFIALQQHDVLHDTRVDLSNAQHNLAFNIDTSYERAASLLEVTDDWLMLQSTKPDHAGLGALKAYLARLTATDPSAVSIVARDADFDVIPLADGAPQEFHDNPEELAEVAGLAQAAPATIHVGLERFDLYVGAEVLPLTMHTSGNLFGIAYLQALIRVSLGEGPYAALATARPSHAGIIRQNGQILLSWPTGNGSVGRYASDFVKVAAANPGGNADFVEVADFPGIGHAYVSYAPLKVAPVGVYSAIPADYIADDIRQRIEIPCLVTVLGAAVTLAGGFLIAHLFRSNRLETENTKQALNAAEAANEAKRQFLANMSHELRTPLNAIIGFAEIMHNQLFGPLGNPQYVGYSRDVYNSGRHLLGIIQTILDMARFEGGNIAIGDGPADLRDLIRETIGTLRERIAGQRLDVHVETERCPLLRVDPLHMRQVLINLLGNAIKFSRAGGVITIETETAGDGLVLRVSDSGVGIAPEAIGKLFKPFAQVDNAYARKHDGVGLGLSICKSIVEAYGGTIALDSTLGVGTTLTIVLPPSRIIRENHSSADAMAAE